MEPRRLLATLLFTDLVDSTNRAEAMGDHAWHQLLERHHELVRAELGRYEGRELDTAGDGFFARFDQPVGAIVCAVRVVEGIQELGMTVRVGVHTGECELFEGKVSGIAASIGSRVCSLAAPGEVLVSSTVRDLVTGSGIAFVDRGLHTLKGVKEYWRLFAVA
jgi:class 3 adenylate cyclase